MNERAQPLQGRTVVVGVGGGIAGYKAVELVRLFTKAGATVRVAMTPRAREFVGPITFQTLSGHPVMTDLFDLTQESEIGHIQVADGADLVVVAPATANVIARMVAGMADCPVTAVVLATTAPVLLAPSMNVNMWNHPITRANLRRLVSEAGVQVVGPGEGFLACRWTGPGRLAEPADIVEAAAHMLTPKDLAGRRVLVTAGPTWEAVDPVRVLANRSSGRMGFALARAAARRGATVELVHGPVALDPPIGVTAEAVESAVQMAAATRRAAETADVVIMAAAVADFRPAEPATRKLKKRDLGASTGLALVRNPDILGELGQARAERASHRPLLVGFAAETDRLVEEARGKLIGKRCDLVVANDVTQPDAGFAVDTNRVVLIDAGGARELELASKDEVSHAILDRVLEMLSPS
ncbi:MAG TPA: bifunctional phosphopantothenoylcysteine decarboxylase/phosphopantothenate--cysteine ligase CoaBC [Kofleriaceae bacterium]|nr:bifunctional phosphopantothenoylcysteine decarboxylase/phosphopantothenate--cysteine ligase CoaBC [Kofleriaceae bacterium]